MRNLFIGIMCICFLGACSSIFEKPITNAALLIYTPADSFVTKEYSQQFYWEPVTGATNYRLQIAKPSFAAGKTQSIEIDTILTSNKIIFTLNAGKYEWRLRAQNGGSETPYTVRRLIINETTFDERVFTVAKPLPGKTTITYSNRLDFEWTKLSGAENYYIEIDTLSGGYTKPVVTKIEGDLTDISVLLKKRGIYNWRMYADSAGIKSQYTNGGKIDFKIDTVTRVTPANNTLSLTQPIELVWKKPSNGISTDVYSYTIKIYDSKNILQTISPVISGETAKINGLTKGDTYYWTVIAEDQYEVESNETTKYKFTVAP